MGPVGGGKLVELPQKAAEAAGVKVKSNAELALRFVLANPNIDCALSGMSTMAQVEENTAIASNLAPLSPEEVAGINRLMDENKRLADLYCTGCNYCMPHCPQQVNIPYIFSAMNLYRVYDLKESGRSQYQFIGNAPWVKGKNASACIECGACEQHCPQKIEIRKQLKECREVFES
jgi:predicted aldo/keto reductase-like oxidoreductase